MGSYMGAKAAIRQRLEDNWTITRIIGPNEVPDDPWPPTIADPNFPDLPNLAPFVYFEIATLPGQNLRGVGTPGDHLSVTRGFIYAHVMVPNGTGTELAGQYAEQIGEIFRTAVFYNTGDGCYVRTWVPRVDEGGSAGVDDDEIADVTAKNWFRQTMSCPFEYWHQG